MKCRVVPGAALTSCVNSPLALAANQESPVLLTVPSVSQPDLPALAGFFVTGLSSPLTPCHFAIAMQMWPGVKHGLRSAFVSGQSDSGTSENVWGPTCFGLVLLTTVRSSPLTTVLGVTK